MKNNDPSFESPFSQSLMGLSMGQDWVMMQNSPFNNESGFSQPVIAESMGQDWAMMQQTPFKNAENTESKFSQGVVGSSMGQDWALMYGPNALNPSQESGFNIEIPTKLGQILNPAAAIGIRTHCGKYCKSLGYAKSDNKDAFKKCISECTDNYGKIIRRKYSIAPATPDVPPVDPTASLPELTDAERASLGIGSTPTAPAKSNMIYWIIGILVLLAIIITAIIMIRRSRAAKA